MYANTCWGLLTLAVGLGLAVPGLPTQYEWLAPWLFGTAVACGVGSIICFGWPLRHQRNRAKVAALIVHPPRAIRLVEPSHIIILGLIIATAGVIWQWRREPAPDPQVALLKTRLTALNEKLSSKELENKQVAPTPAAKAEMVSTVPTAPPPASRKKFMESEARHMIEALSTIQEILNRKVSSSASSMDQLFPQIGDRYNLSRQITTMMTRINGMVQVPPITDLVRSNLQAKRDRLQKFLDEINAAQKDLSEIYGAHPRALMEEIHQYFDNSYMSPKLNETIGTLRQNFDYFLKQDKLDMDVFDILKPMADRWTEEVKAYQKTIDTNRASITPAIQQLRENL
jgi:hypothetical protein